MTRRFEDTDEIPHGVATPDWDSYGVSLPRLMRLYPHLTAEQLVSVAGNAFLVHHRRSRRLSSSPSSTAVTTPGAPAVTTGESITVLYPLRRRPDSDRAVVCIGRLDGNDVCITDPTVSKYHAFVRIEDGVYLIQDANSKNGTHVDTFKVPARGAGPPKPLRYNCTLRFGSVVTMLIDAKAVIELVEQR